jgi:hypothetical protein
MAALSLASRPNIMKRQFDKPPETERAEEGRLTAGGDMAGGRKIKAAACAFLGVVWSAPSLAEDGECRSFGVEFRDLYRASTLSLARIGDRSPRVNFIKREDIREGCPSKAPACRDKAYLVPGNEIVISGAKDAFVCATYVSPKGRVSDGWLPRSAVIPVQSPSPIETRDWLGKWRSGPEQEIVIGAGSSSDGLTIKGDATWGGSDPERVKRGAFNIGELEGEAAATGADLSFDMGEGGTLSYEEADEADCKVQMRRLGSYLLVRDNNLCGGMNVSFTGIYRR